MSNTTKYRRQGWTISITQDGKTFTAEVTDFMNEPAAEFEVKAFDSLEIAKGYCEGWCDGHPRYTSNVATAFGGSGYIAVISQHGKGEVQRLSSRATMDEANESGQAWIAAKVKQEGEIEDRRRALSLELAPKLEKLIAKNDKLKAERKKLNDKIKANEEEIRETVKEANSPQIPMEFIQPPAKVEESTPDDGIEDDGKAVADAKGHFADGPQLPPEKKSRRGKRRRKGADHDTETDATAGEIEANEEPATNGKRPGLDPSKVVWPKDEDHPSTP